MSVVPIPIDGNNMGLRLDGQVAVDVLRLDLVTASVQSDYLLPGMSQVLSSFAARLFALVAPESRVAGALGLLTRICAVSPADNSVVSAAASVSGNTATLRVSVDAAPAALIVTIPHSASGGVIPGSGSSAPVPPPIDDGSNIVLLSASEALSTGDAVSRNPETGLVWKALPATPERMPAIGLVVGREPDGRYRVQVSGVVRGVYVSDDRPTLFVSQTGRLTTDLTGIPRLQVMGFWVASDGFALHIDPRVLVRSQ